MMARLVFLWGGRVRWAERTRRRTARLAGYPALEAVIVGEFNEDAVWVVFGV